MWLVNEEQQLFYELNASHEFVIYYDVGCMFEINKRLN